MGGCRQCEATSSSTGRLRTGQRQVWTDVEDVLMTVKQRQLQTSCLSSVLLDGMDAKEIERLTF